jgi:hypothetical protein
MKSKEEIQASWKALDDFCIYWQAQGKLKWHYRQLATFQCHIDYFMKDHIRQAETTAHMWHDGKIELDESEWLNTVDHYLGFSTEWQSYCLTSTHALRVEGRGTKIAGPYWLEIIPL